MHSGQKDAKKLLKPLLQLTKLEVENQENSVNGKQNIGKDINGKSEKPYVFPSGLFALIRPTTATPNPRRPTSRIITGLLKPVSKLKEESPDAKNTPESPKKITRRPNNILKPVKPSKPPSPTKKPTSSKSKESLGNKLEKFPVTQRPSSKLSSLLKRPEKSATTATPRKKKLLKTGGCELNYMHIIFFYKDKLFLNYLSKSFSNKINTMKLQSLG